MTQAQELARVEHHIADYVIDFCRLVLSRPVPEFFADELRRYVSLRTVGAPASPDRVLRDLRKKGAVQYRVISRSGSLYRVEAVV